MEALAEGRERALADTGRVEFGDGILPALIDALCDSPYLQQSDWAETLLSAQAVFYTGRRRPGTWCRTGHCWPFSEGPSTAPGELYHIWRASP